MRTKTVVLVLCVCLFALTRAEASDTCDKFKAQFADESISTKIPANQTVNTICLGDSKTSCCDLNSYKKMLTWWDYKGRNSFSRTWRDKILTISKEINDINVTYQDKIYKYADIIQNRKSSNIECDLILQDVQTLRTLHADLHAFEAFAETSGKCWEYSINFLRGYACGSCDASHYYWIYGKKLIVNDKECSRFASSCAFHLSAYYTLYEYIRLWAEFSECKTHGFVKAGDIETMKNPFDSYTVQLVNECQADFNGDACMELCKQDLPWTGLTKREYVSFPSLMVFVGHIKNAFNDPDDPYHSDSVLDMWTTPEDEKLYDSVEEVKVGNNGDGLIFTEWVPGFNEGLAIDEFASFNATTVEQYLAGKNASNLIQFSLFVLLIALFLVFPPGG